MWLWYQQTKNFLFPLLSERLHWSILSHKTVYDASTPFMDSKKATPLTQEEIIVYCMIHSLLRHNNTYLYAGWWHTVQHAIMSHHMCIRRMPSLHAHSDQRTHMRRSVNKRLNLKQFQLLSLRLHDLPKVRLLTNSLLCRKGTAVRQKNRRINSFLRPYTDHLAAHFFSFLNQCVMKQEHKQWMCVVVLFVAGLLQDWQEPEGMKNRVRGNTWQYMNMSGGGGEGRGGIIDLSSAHHDRDAQKDGQVERRV